MHLPKERKDEAMIATLDHHAMLVLLALATVMCALLLGVSLLFAGAPVQTLPDVTPSGISTNSYGTGGANLNGHPSVVEMHKTMML
jgi:hypothetical protein